MSYEQNLIMFSVTSAVSISSILKARRVGSSVQKSRALALSAGARPLKNEEQWDVGILIRYAPEILFLVACSLLLAGITYYSYPIW